MKKSYWQINLIFLYLTTRWKFLNDLVEFFYESKQISSLFEYEDNKKKYARGCFLLKEEIH
jgi:uncharacterized membrane protein YpjA